ncbi:preprotein translocase subunit SecA [Phosphitispora sp. TUW77]|uniref:preprotein translocase subunit SecA n=1 Tax=Phosphitispora sp. TUW77 TaxID=3152361 RepID=UPI003AB41415
MLGFVKKLFDDNAKIIKKLQKTVDEINHLEPEIERLTNPELQGKTEEFKNRLANGTDLDDILPEAFAVVREASKRVLGMRHFDVQLIGGIVLHQGRISEMKTGEGKTLVATLPAYLNALTGRGVHIITVNDYLATRDSEWMGQIFKFLGLSVGLIVHGLDYDEKIAAYNSDIVYGTNNEFGFDYLRDNMVVQKENMVQRDLYYAIVDEVDSILIDEARTPLIISGQSAKAADLYYRMAKIVPRLKKDQHFTVDEKAHTVILTEDGVAAVEQFLGVQNLYEDEHIELTHHLNQALKAHALMKRDRDYVVKDGEVIIVDEFTGRLMLGRRYSEGLHQAIEAKEGVKIERESQTLATITFQNYFRMYEKLAGMTGTAITEEDEFRKIYGLDVVVIPTNKPMIRKDLPDVIFKTEKAKFNAAVDEIEQLHVKGQPVLVGTISIEKSEELSLMLKKRGIPHKVLNAKYHDKEAEIVAQAGRFGAVTIATNMAGRGTDILLGGNPEFLTQTQAKKSDDVQADREEFESLFKTIKEEIDREHEKVVSLGGLHIIGTERHESRRIDNQLRGRAGRQGDPGSTKFYISMEDDLMRLFGSDNISSLMDKLGMEEDIPIEHSLITKSIETAQKRVENRNFDIRKHVLEYDDVMNKQREVIYEQRRQVLLEENLRETINQMIHILIDGALDIYCNPGVHPEEWDLQGLLDHAKDLYLPHHELTAGELTDMGRAGIKDLLYQKSMDTYDAREQELGEENTRHIEKVILLKIVDEKWMDHLDAMDQLRQGIGLRAYGQKDPLVEYKFEGYEMFQNMISSIQEDVVRYIFRVNVVKEPAPQQQNVTENRYNGDNSPKQPRKAENQVGRNDPCPCGSGKKYKKCCGI